MGDVFGGGGVAVYLDTVSDGLRSWPYGDVQ